MTSKLSFIAFAPFSVAAIAIEIIRLFFMDTNGMFFIFDDLMMSYLSIACAVLVLLFAVVFCLVDKKTAPAYIIRKNFVCGILGFLLAVTLASDGANKAFLLIRNAQYTFVDIADIVLTILCAIVFVVLALNHFVGNGGVKGLGVFYLLPAIWSAFRLVACFLDFTTVSISVSDITILVCYIFATLFLFNYAMVIALIKGKSPVRSAFIFGLPAVTILLAYGVYALTNTFVLKSGDITLFANLETLELTALALYILAFVIEMSICVKKKDEIELIEDLEDQEEYVDAYDPDADMVNAIANSVTNGNKPDEVVNETLPEGFDSDHLAIDDEVFLEVAQASMNNQNDDYITDVDASDFIYGSVPTDDDFVLPTSSEDTDDTYAAQSESADMYITKADSTYDVEEDAHDDDVDARMDRIDRLILEISEDGM
ncbi:MAG: hypothetical protein IIX27_04845 [Ruminococcus sp.]|nr:hypothetical protein [Ruminococcus sp.]